jgi:hypothetical protein
VNLPLFQLDPSHPRNADKAACTTFRTHVLKLLDLYYPTMQTALDNSWLSQHQTAMDLLTSRWETGANETMADVTVTMLPGTPMHRSGDRLGIYYSTGASAPLGPLTATWSEPGLFPCFDQLSGAPPLVPCTPGKTTDGGDFDASYTVTTNTMNHVIRERFPNLTLTPTFDQLKIAPPAGKAGTDMWQVDGTWLSALFPAALGDLGNTKLTIKMVPARQPFLYIHPETAYWFVNGVFTSDSSTYRPGIAPLTYQMGQYKIILEGDQAGPDGTNNWLEFLVDLYDADFKLDVSADAAQNVLVPSYSGYKGYLFTLVKNQLSGCPVSPISKPLEERCGERLMTLVANTVKPLLDSMLLDLVKGYPAPLLFDANGKAAQTRRFKQASKYIEQQVMTFYGTLE